MSVILEDINKKIWLYCKGADSILLERMDKSKNPEIDETQKHLSTFANEGLRTLLICKKEIPRDIYNSWAKAYLVHLTFRLSNNTRKPPLLPRTDRKRWKLCKKK